MTHHPLRKWKLPFSASKIKKQLVQIISLQMSSSMVGVLYIGGCTILSLNTGAPSVSCSNGKIPMLSLHTSRKVATVLTSPFPLWQATFWPKLCSPVTWSMLWILSCLNLNAVSCVGATQLTYICCSTTAGKM